VFRNRACIVGAFIAIVLGAWSGLGWLIGPESAGVALALWLVVGTVPADHHPYPRELDPVRRFVAGTVAWLVLVQVVAHFIA
jgi:hypothetical protein